MIFDAYGTLFSTGNGSIEATRKILSLQEKAIDAATFYAEWKKIHRKHIDESIKTSFVTEKDIFVKDLKVLYEQYQIERPFEEDVQSMLDSLVGRKVFPEVPEAMEQLRKRYRVVIGSTTDTAPLLENIRCNNLMVDKVYTSEMIQKYKPDIRFYQNILQSEGCKSEEAVFIGDSLVDDIEGPKCAGITTVLVDRKNKYDMRSKVKPDYIVRDIGEISSVLYNMHINAIDA